MVSKIDSEAADAGLFGTTSSIILTADALLLDLFNYYSAYPSGFQESLAREYRAEQMTGKILVPASQVQRYVDTRGDIGVL